MHLSPEALQAVAGAIGAAASSSDEKTAGPATAAGPEHRRDRRVTITGSAVIIPYPDRTGRRPVRVTVHDLAPRGIGFEHSEALYPGEWFLLHLPQSGGDCPRALLCTVMHCRPSPRGGFFLGAAFLRAVEAANGAARNQPAVIPTPILNSAFALPAADPADSIIQELKELLAKGIPATAVAR